MKNKTVLALFAAVIAFAFASCASQAPTVPVGGGGAYGAGAATGGGYYPSK